MIQRVVIFGASGDLASRYLFPALVQLEDAARLPEGFRLVGAARDEWTTHQLREHLAAHLPRPPSEAAGRVLAAAEYRRADVTDRAQVRAALAGSGAAVVYLALPPAVFGPAIEAAAAAGLARGSRIVVEKPFGESLEDARALNRLLHEVFPEDAVFRLDHFLGKQTVQNILGLRFANRVFEPLWNALHVARVEIVWDETLTVEGRGYYDAAGALKDMVQNHLLQLLCLVGMEPPPALDARSFRDRKVDVLRAVRRLTPEEVARQTVRGRYAAGRVGDRDVPAYVEEGGVDPSRGTETFAQVTLPVDNWRWAGVPFVLRTGKALRRARREVAIRFKPVPHLAFGQQAAPGPNVLRLALDPDRLSLDLNINGPGDPFELDPVALDVTLAPQEPGAYARLLLDVLQGDPVLSIRDDEAEESWRIIEPIARAWAEGAVPLLDYPAGSDGPPAAGPSS